MGVSLSILPAKAWTLPLISYADRRSSPSR